MWVSEAAEILKINRLTRRHDPVVWGGHSCPPPLNLGFLTALGQDVEITVRPTRKPHGEVSVVA